MQAKRIRNLAGIAIVFALIGFVVSFLGRPPPVVRGAPASQERPPPGTTAAFAKGGCAVCHTIPGIPNAVGQVGPNLSAIGAEAGGRVSGLDAQAYIQQSILEPNAVIAPVCPLGDCPTDVMPPNLGEKLAESELTAIVDYLLTLSGAEAAAGPAYELVPIEIVRPPEASVTPFTEPPQTYPDAQVLLGKYLFFDPRISGDASISCATCHQPDLGWTDGQALSDGYPTTLYFRNVQTVMNTVYLDRLYWDGRMDGEDMPTLVRDHLTEAHFMNMDGRLMVERLKQVPEYVQLFQDAYEQGPSFGRVLNAVTAYVHSLNSAESSYDRFLAGEENALSESANAGLALFEGKAGCSACHSGPALSDSAFYALPVEENPEIWADPLRHITFRRFFRLFGVSNYRALREDPGLFALTQLDDDFGKFRTAPLRELNRTGPYMHNGAFDSLQAVVQFYNAGAVDGRPLELTGTELDQLVAFLESLSTEPLPVEAPELPDYQIRALGENQ